MKTAATIVLFCSASAVANTAASVGSGGDIKAMDSVRLKCDAFSKHDAGAIEQVYASGAIPHGPDDSDLAGNKQIADTYRSLFDAIPGANDNRETLENSPSHIYAQFVLTGHSKGA